MQSICRITSIEDRRHTGMGCLIIMSTQKEGMITPASFSLSMWETEEITSFPLKQLFKVTVEPYEPEGEAHEPVSEAA